jgi:phosphotransferase system enzyme I (PtsI)
MIDPHHEAVMRLIRMTVENAHTHGKWVGICGELGADGELTETFLRMGVDELSVSPTYVLRLRDRIRNMDLSQAEKAHDKKQTCMEKKNGEI